MLGRFASWLPALLLALLGCDNDGDPGRSWASGADDTGGAGVPARLGDFEADTRAANGAQWHAFTDVATGGGSRVTIERVAGGAGGSAGALHVEGHVPLEDFPFPFGGVRLALGPVTGGQAAAMDISRYQGIEFQARGDGKQYFIRLMAADVHDFNYHHHVFRAGPEWERHRVRFADLVQFQWGSPRAWSGTAVRGVLITNYSPPGEEPGDIEFYIDDVKLFE